MKRNTTIQIKAGFLLVVFAFNIVVGFACGLGIDMGFNSNSSKSSHHPGKIHVHADGKKHQHETATHSEGDKKHHDNDHHEKGGCCTDGVVKLAQAEKSVPQATVLMNPLFPTAFIATFYPTNIFYKSQVTEPIKYFVRGHHPPIPDIRLAIQSFQI